MMRYQVFRLAEAEGPKHWHSMCRPVETRELAVEWMRFDAYHQAPLHNRWVDLFNRSQASPEEQFTKYRKHCYAIVRLHSDFTTSWYCRNPEDLGDVIETVVLDVPHYEDVTRQVGP